MLVVGGSGAATAFLLIRGASEEILQLVPASSDVVVTAYLDPSGGQKINLLSLKDRFPALRDERLIGDEVDRALDEALAGSGLTHDDVLPWLGSQAALAVDLDMEPTPEEVTTTLFLVSTDDDAAAAALGTALGSLGPEETREHAGVTMHVFGSDPSATYALVDGVVVLSDHTSGVTQAIDAAEGAAPAMADDLEFLNTVSSLPEGRLALAYANLAQIFDDVLAASELLLAADAPQLGALRAMRGMGMALSAQPDGLALDVALRLDESELDEASRAQLDVPVGDNAMLSFVPSDSFVVAAQQGFDAGLRQMVDQALATPDGERIRQRLGLDETLAGLTGDLAFEVGPGSGVMPVAGAILIGVSDEAAAQRTLDGLADLAVARRSARESFEPSESGFSRRELRELGLWPPPGKPEWKTSRYQGTTIHYLEDPSLSTMLLPAYAVVDGAAIVATSPNEVRRVIDTARGSISNITTSTSYTLAVDRVPSGTSTFYVDVSAVVAMLAPTLPPEVTLNLEPVKTIVAGSSSSPTLVTERVFVEIG